MPKRKPNHIKQRDWDAVDSPPLTDGQLRRLRPAAEVKPAIVEAYRLTRRRRKTRPSTSSPY
jgi:hypothetical protein